MQTELLRILLLGLTLNSVRCTTGTETIQVSKEEFERVKDALHDLQQVVADLTTFNKQILVANQEIKEENHQLKADNLAIKVDLQETEADLDKLNSKVESQQKLIEDLLVSISDNDEERYQYEKKTHSQNQAFLSAEGQIRRNIHVKPGLRKRHTESTVVRLNGRGTDGRHGTGVQTIIMALKKGDQVAVLNTHDDIGYWGDKYCSYSGFLIEEFGTDLSSIVG